MPGSNGVNGSTGLDTVAAGVGFVTPIQRGLGALTLDPKIGGRPRPDFEDAGEGARGGKVWRRYCCLAGRDDVYSFANAADKPVIVSEVLGRDRYAERQVGDLIRIDFVDA